MCAVSRYVTDILSIRSDPSIRISFTHPSILRCRSVTAAVELALS